MFGGEVARRVAEGYKDAFLTAHLEVPGEMFELAAQAKRERDMGVVGSTQNILDFVREKTREAADAGRGGTLRFVLGTEMGMVTPLVAAVREDLQGGPPELDVDIVFPVSSEAATPVERVQHVAPGGGAVSPCSSRRASPSSRGYSAGRAAASTAGAPTART